MSQKMGFFIRKSPDTGESISGLLPLVDVAGVLITSGDKVLAVYNEKWGAFTIPLTKRRSWKDPGAEKDQERVEDWEDAALRAASEWMGRTTTQVPEHLGDVAEFQQSDRDAQWKRYRVQAYRIQLDEDASLPAGKIAEWLTVDELLDEKRRPVSPTARHVVAELRLKRKV